ncbi:MAG: MHYT domain-containing protein, partial [Myxococcota bacterium]
MSIPLLRFTTSTTDLSQACAVGYDPLLVALSFSVAALATFTALRISDRLQSVSRPVARGAWIASGAFALGSGIWAMHFIAVLALKLPFRLHFDLALTLLSPIPACLGSAIALHVLSRPQPPFWRLNGAGLLLGLGIGAMHYSGMAAMVLDAEVRFDPVLFLASIVVAQALATLALFTRFGLRARLQKSAGWINGASGLIMGAAVAATHYTGMAATYFLPQG